MTDKPKAYSAAAEVGQIRERRTWVQIAKIELRRAPYSAWFGLIVIAIYLFVGNFCTTACSTW
jgi:peptide/nickel transport system permease protein